MRIVIFTLLILISCKSNLDNFPPLEPVDLGTIFETTDYKIAVKRIDSTKYHQEKDHSRTKNLTRISDPTQLMRQITQQVELIQEEGYSIPYIRSINFSEGGTYTSYYDPPYTTRYYPDLSILVCEAGHSAEEIFNLKNGLTEEVIGDPETYITSTNETYQFAGYYNGQQFDYFIQQHTVNGFEKIVPLQDIMVDSLNIHFVSYEVKWSNDSTFLLHSKDVYNKKTNAEDQIFLQITILKTNKNAVSINHFRSTSYHTFIPSYVTITDSIRGDIDGDGKKDIVLLTEQNDKNMITKNEYGELINENPRGLIIALKRGENYVLVSAMHNCFEPFQSKNTVYNNELNIEIKNKQIKLYCSYGRFGGTEYTFAFNKKKMELITYKQFEIDLGITVKETLIDSQLRQKTIWECVNVSDVVYNEASIIYNETKKKITYDRKLTMTEIGQFTELNIEEYYR